ncbi:MAG TPA: hypothetical protein PLL36_00950 [Candidatus Hydrogenedentes bacterium]|jgi:hypothetical protein|nr:hypothetical protein [Candidatus Hydrogenedentota bacterium]HQM99607.1 hypothetical protein [Candidatus Hydrogenedentota bacterium]
MNWPEAILFFREIWGIPEFPRAEITPYGAPGKVRLLKPGIKYRRVTLTWKGPFHPKKSTLNLKMKN